jgi:hypothetical protein
MFRFDRLFSNALVVAAFVWLVASSASAAPPDWPALAESETVLVLTSDEDGEARETKIWMVVIDGTPYIRTSQSTRWGDNVERNRDIALRIDGTDYPVQAVFIEDGAERERIVAVFEEKYGSNPILNWIRGDNPRIMRLDPPQAPAP